MFEFVRSDYDYRLILISQFAVARGRAHSLAGRRTAVLCIK